MHGSAMLYEAAIASEIFGVDRSELSTSGEWFDLVVCTPDGTPHPWLRGPADRVVRRDRARRHRRRAVDRRPRRPTRIRPGRGAARGPRARRPGRLPVHRRLRAGGGRAPRRPRRDDALDARRRARPPLPGDRRAAPTSSTSTRATCSPRPARPRRSTSASTSYAATSAPRPPTGSPGGWSSRRTAAAARRSSSPRRPSRGAPTGSRRRSSGPAPASTSRSPCATSPSTPASAPGSSPAGCTPSSRRGRSTGCTSSAYAAQELLERTDASVEQVAAGCGMGTAATLRRHFHRAVGVTPTAYRATFRVG